MALSRNAHGTLTTVIRHHNCHPAPDAFARGPVPSVPLPEHSGRSVNAISNTDPGVDDAMAIFYALAHPNLDLLGLTTAFGNVAVERDIGNALALVHAAGSPVPGAGGAAPPRVRVPRSVPTHIRQRRLRIIVPFLMGHNPKGSPQPIMHLFDSSAGAQAPDDGRPVRERLHPAFVMPDLA